MVRKRITKSYGLNNPLQNVFPEPVKAQRAPTIRDTGYEIGQTWIDQSESISYILVNASAGSVEWLPSGGATITPFVVDQNRAAGYDTIQDALDAANDQGGGLIYLRQGTYTENLTMYDNTQVVTLLQPEVDQPNAATIIGNATPPTTGSCGFYAINFVVSSAGDVMESTAGGTATVVMANCNMNILDGYIYDMPNWTGKLYIDNCDSSASTEDGVVNLVASQIIISNSSVGAGTNLSMKIAGTSIIRHTTMNTAIIQSASGSIIINNSRLGQGIAIQNDSTANIFDTSFLTSDLPAITYNSSLASTISNITIDTSNDPAIAGTSTGTLTINNCSFIRSSTIASTVNRAGGNVKSANWSMIQADQFSEVALGQTFKQETLAAGTVSVTATGILATDQIFIQRISGGTSIGFLTYVITGGVGFVINSRDSAGVIVATDVSTVAYWIIRGIV